MAQYHDLSDLKKLSHDLKVQAKAAQEAKRVQATKANRLGAEAAAFREAMASLGVKNEDHTRGRRITTPAKPAPVPHQSKLEKEAVLEESLSDQCDPVVFLESDDGLMFRRPDVPPDIPRKLYRGEWTVQDHIDLHGLFVDEARDAVAAFINLGRNARRHPADALERQIIPWTGYSLRFKARDETDSQIKRC